MESMKGLAVLCSIVGVMRLLGLSSGLRSRILCEAGCGFILRVHGSYKIYSERWRLNLTFTEMWWDYSASAGVGMILKVYVKNHSFTQTHDYIKRSIPPPLIDPPPR